MTPFIGCFGGFGVVTDATGWVNAGWISGTHGTLAIDAMFTADDVQGLQEVIRCTGSPPVNRVLLTHEHSDHARGLPGYGETKVFAHEVTVQALESRAAGWGDPDFPIPTATFEQAWTLDLGGMVVEIRPVGGHATGLCVVFNPQDRSVWVSDLVFAGCPAVVAPESDLDRWLQALAELESWQPQVVVPGHGLPGGPELLSAQREWLLSFRERVRELRDSGTDLETALDALRRELNLAQRVVAIYRATLSRIWRQSP